MDKGKHRDTALNHLTSGHTTTLYDLIAAMQDAARPGEEALIVPTIVQWLQAGRITFHGNIGGLIREGALS